jgi:hypothetical protein
MHKRQIIAIGATLCALLLTFVGTSAVSAAPPVAPPGQAVAAAHVCPGPAGPGRGGGEGPG